MSAEDPILPENPVDPPVGRRAFLNERLQLRLRKASDRESALELRNLAPEAEMKLAGGGCCAERVAAGVRSEDAVAPVYRNLLLRAFYRECQRESQIARRDRVADRLHDDRVHEEFRRLGVGRQHCFDLHARSADTDAAGSPVRAPRTRNHRVFCRGSSNSTVDPAVKRREQGLSAREHGRHPSVALVRALDRAAVYWLIRSTRLAGAGTEAS